MVTESDPNMQFLNGSENLFKNKNKHVDNVGAERFKRHRLKHSHLNLSQYR